MLRSLSSKPQILLKARFASVDRNVEKQLELNVFTLGVANSIGSGTTQQFSPPVIFALSSLLAARRRTLRRFSLPS
jgi:hypothetical protein